MVNIVAMNNGLYNPFQNFDFLYKTCFLSGKTFNSPVVQVPLLPQWLLNLARLTGEEQIQFLDESIRSYQDLFIPVNTEINEQFLNPLEAKISDAFKQGYAGVSALSELDLFNWIGKFLYGFIYIEMHSALRKEMTADGLNMSQSLMMKFANLNFMMQNLYTQIEFEDFTPWSITVVKLADEATPFSFRDEINTLTFSLKMKDFGIIACLQDNGTNKRYHQDIINEIQGKALTAEQFEELSARFYYSAYLFNRLPEYTFMPVEGITYIEAMPLRGNMSKPLFDAWQHKTYGQVLENFWKPWGYVLFEIIKNPEEPMSFFEKPCLPNAG
ncbi:hypothetical protein [Pedobacter rhizosphaerae]|uniref:Uncharacterized protein n=1 Tax=Pedobacter rhizosphaerae TaxID=390241 RepID=A0A1H9S9P4_9SPHI|nr:hypothetical protein [Pedobacter rhizosphaerae]SER81712.1 hypothetical protein SAMN04488023_11740 [Pedobacter rhizosphaerae]